MPRVSRGRWARGMLSVAGVEHRSPVLASAARVVQLRTAGGKAWRRDVDLSPLPAAVRPNRHGRYRRMWAPVAADLVAVAKFDVDDCVKLRSFYADAGVSARLQVGRGDAHHGISRTLEAYRQVSRHVPELMPRIDDHGPAPFSRGVYLVEELISGSHPASRDEIQEVAEPLAALLLRLHRGVGVTSRALSGVIHKQMRERWSAFARDAGVDGALDAAVRRVVERDDLVEVSLGHGDLVGSNIMIDDGRVVLIDWEYAGEGPIVFDLAKVHLNSRDPEVAQACLERGLEHSVGRRRGHYSFAEQLALAHVQMLSWHRARSAKAVKAGRSRVLAAQTRQRLQAIARLLGVHTAAAGETRRYAAV